jgi:alkanesulfonate monooxygenase SsuD/methylene tetrahydromethanopterin reductase-like flavin-dependent oxidoreductase (luciferase family)
MKFALFYEIPVARPWTRGKEHQAFKDVIEQAVLGDQLGFHSFWTVEHHFLEEFSHCSNPEVLYGAVAARTRNLRIGYGVRLLPKPYNHPVRTAESVAVLDLISDGRVEFGTGRSATRLELEGFGIDPRETRAMWREALDHVVGCWTHDEYEFSGKYWSMPRRRVLPKPLQEPHPPLWAATTSLEGHRLIGQTGVGLCSFSVGVPPEEFIPRLAEYRAGLRECTQPAGLVRNERAATFTMVHCADTNARAFDEAAESMVWYPSHGGKIIGALAEWMAEEELKRGSYGYAADLRKVRASGVIEARGFDYFRDSGAAMVGDPDRCIEIAKRYEKAGCDLLLCLFNPYKIPHEQVMRSIELVGKYVIPEFKS